MLKSAYIVPGVVYRIEFHQDGSYFGLVGETGIGYLFFAEFRERDGVFVLSTQYEELWSNELRLRLPPPGNPSRNVLELKFNGRHLEIWNPEAAIDFIAYGEVQSKATRFAKFALSTDPQNAFFHPFPGIDQALSLIDSHILSRRLERVEQQLGFSKPAKSSIDE